MYWFIPPWINLKYLIYKLVTSPYGRGRGIGTAFLAHLAENIPEKASIYLYVWEKQDETLEFFRNKGFEPGRIALSTGT